MIVTLDIPASTRRRIRRDGEKARQMTEVLADGIEAAVSVGADAIAAGLVEGNYGLTMQHPAAGLAASTMGWMIDRSGPLGAVGVPSNTPAAAYAAIHEYGGTITPKNARALAVPVSDEAKQYSSPRDMEGLVMITRPGKPPLLVRPFDRRGTAAGFELHWVLLASVTIPARHWLSRGAADAKDEMLDVFRDVVMEHWTD